MALTALFRSSSLIVRASSWAMFILALDASLKSALNSPIRRRMANSSFPNRKITLGSRDMR